MADHATRLEASNTWLLDIDSRPHSHHVRGLEAKHAIELVRRCHSIAAVDRSVRPSKGAHVLHPNIGLGTAPSPVTRGTGGNMRKLGQVIIGIVALQAGCSSTTTFFDAGFDATDAPIDTPVDTLPDGTLIDALLGTTIGVLLTPALEVPVCASAGTSATGAATIFISADNTMLSVINLTWSGLTGPATLAHINAGPVGAAGPIIFNLAPLTLPINETFTAIEYPTPAPPGAPATFALFVQLVKAGGAYLSIDTTLCPTGAIRGQF
jgi:hypothetical protein